MTPLEAWPRSPGVLAYTQVKHHYGPGAFIGVGIFLILVGSLLLWAGTVGKEWINTRSRAFKPVPHYSRRQSAFNARAGRVCGAIGIVAGILLIIVR